MSETVHDVHGAMQVDWDVPITTSDGLVLRADVFRPVEGPPVPVLLSYGPYAKGLPFQEGFATAWEKMVTDHPDVTEGSSGRFQNWEVADPEKWVHHGYACVRVDSRGSGRSPGRIDHFSERETQDFAECIEWSGTRPWSNGKVGLCGISYYAINQWQVAARRPEHLAAICPWEGAGDLYRELARHGGILCTFGEHWHDMQITPLQYGNGRASTHPVSGHRVTGDEKLDDETLAANDPDFAGALREAAFAGDEYFERTADPARIEVPLLSAGNWGGAGLHLRGNVEAYLAAGSRQKWLEMHGLEHWTEYYTDYGRELQKEFFDHFLKGVDNGWDRRPPVLLRVRHVDGTFEDRTADAWPLPETVWTDLYLDAATGTLREHSPAGSQTSYREAGEGATFTLPARDRAIELTGPLSLKLFVSSDTDDADLFVIVRAFDPDDEEITFVGAIDPHAPPAQGWLRASHRELDITRSTPYRPFHPHEVRRPLEPGRIYEVDVEIWPTSLVLPPGHRLAVTVQGHDYEHPGVDGDRLSNIKNVMRGSGPFLHDDPVDRPALGAASGAATVTVHTGGDAPSRLLVPFIPR